VGVALSFLALGIVCGVFCVRAYDKWLARKHLPPCAGHAHHARPPSTSFSATETHRSSLPDASSWEIPDHAEQNYYCTTAELSTPLARSHSMGRSFRRGNSAIETGTLGRNFGNGEYCSVSSQSNRNSSGSSTATYVRVPDREYDTATIKRISIPVNSLMRADLARDEPFNT
jgi:hypothetical protein